MPGNAGRGARPPADIRLQGFADRAALAVGVDWIDAHSAALVGNELVQLGEAAGRVFAAPLLAPEDMPASDRAAIDGYAVRADATIGAGDYNPLPLPGGSAALVAAGAPLPAGADAVLPFEATQPSGASIDILGAVAVGAGIERRGQWVRAGDTLVAGGRVLRPQDLGLLAASGKARVAVLRRPRIRLVVAAAKNAGGIAPRDANAPMLAALAMRDGGVIEALIAAAGRAALRSAIAAPGADAVIVAGRTGSGPDDEAPLALADAGTLALHGVALRPGGSAGLGCAGAIPVILLPGDPLACLCAYELLAGRLVRRLGGHAAALPYRTVEAEAARKIVSAVGVVDMCRVRVTEGRAEPIGSAESGGLASTVRADGFILVPEPLEGYAPGARVRIYLYDGAEA